MGPRGFFCHAPLETFSLEAMSRELLDATVPPAFLFRKAHSDLKSQVEPQRSGYFWQYYWIGKFIALAWESEFRGGGPVDWTRRLCGHDFELTVMCMQNMKVKCIKSCLILVKKIETQALGFPWSCSFHFFYFVFEIILDLNRYNSLLMLFPKQYHDGHVIMKYCGQTHRVWMRTSYHKEYSLWYFTYHSTKN